MSYYISGLEARMILDSRGNPTVEVDCYVDGALRGRAAVPSGASTGSHEAVELRDGEVNRWMGKGVEGAVTNVVERIQDALVGLPVDNQRVLDEIMIEMDDSGNKASLGANATLGTSLACLHAASNVHQLPLWRYLGGISGGSLPVPMMNILNGGAHAASNGDVQELCNAALMDDETHQIQIIDKIVGTGITFSEIYEFFLPEAAALLGIYWEESKISFSQVSLASQRLQKLARIFEKNYLGSLYSFGPGPEVMLILPEEELHMLGMVIAAGMFRKEGANPTVVVGRPIDKIYAEIQEREFALVGISLVNREKLPDVIQLAEQLKMRFKQIPLVLGTKISILELNSEKLKIFDLVTSSPKDALDHVKNVSRDL